MKRVLSIDQSSRVTGYAIFDNKNLVTFGHFSIPANKTMGQRLESFFNHLKDLLEKYNIQTLYFVSRKCLSINQYPILCWG